jgi:hypothetical protein
MMRVDREMCLIEEDDRVHVIAHVRVRDGTADLACGLIAQRIVQRFDERDMPKVLPSGLDEESGGGSDPTRCWVGMLQVAERPSPSRFLAVRAP